MDRARVHVIPDTAELDRPNACAALRLVQPFSHPTLTDRFEVSFGPALPDGPIDAVVMQRRGTPALAPAAIRRRGAKLIYDLDDNLLDPHPDPTTEDELARFRPTVRALLREADLVTVSTEKLRERVLRLNPAVATVPNALDERLIRPAPAPRTGAPLRIGYYGTFSHLRDLMSVLFPLRTALSQLAEPATLVLCGISTDPRLPALFDGFCNVEILPATGNYPDFLGLMRAHADWHVGLAPLADGAFEDAKSDIKYLEYAAFGVPGLYSAHPAYATVRDGLTGLVAPASSWPDRLLALCTDAALRARIAAAARADLLATRTLAAAGARRAGILLDLLGKPR